MKENGFLTGIMTKTNPTLMSLSLLFLRCTIGVLLFIGGSGKLFGWFGGYGIKATLEGFSKIGLSAFLTYLSSYTEFLGGFLLVFGFLTRPAAFAIMINMVVATLVSLPRGFMGPTGAQTAFIFLVIDIVILLSGPKTFSVDALIFRKSDPSK
jgi:putative oxidoreductase